MKLCYSPTSPYVRKASVTIRECGLEDRVELIPTNPWDPTTDLPTHNPIGKVPALITDDGQPLFDSPVICEYLDSLHHGDKLYPPTGATRWSALRQQALADGILDAAVLAFLEIAKRPEQYCWSDWVKRQKSAMQRSLDALEEESKSFGDSLTIGQIATGCALGYLDFRFADDNWRAGRPNLATWSETFFNRPSMVATVPKDPT